MVRGAPLVALVWLALGATAARAERSPASEVLDARIARALAPVIVDGERSRSWPRRPLLDAAREAVGVERVWSAPMGTRGAGATVCVLDTGVDLTHRDFRDGRGHTRVRWLLDLDGEPRDVHSELERGGGAVWSSEEIDDALARGEPPAPDWNGHGTSVASAAVGDDAGELAMDPGARAGLAPEASLVVVRALRRGTPGLRDDDLVRGARFCADPRVSPPERTVILLALGGHDGPHDGTGPLERALTAITASGVAVVAAAGNDGDRAVHAGARLVRDEPVRMVLRVPSPEIDDALVSIVVRGAREVRASTPGGSLTRWVPTGEIEDDGALRIDASDPDATYVLWRGALRAGELVVEARGARERGQGVDAWLVDDHLGAALFAPRFVGPTALAGEEVTVPATADGVVAVGASVSRDFLPGETGPGLTLDADEAGRATFSSRGPRVDGAPLPTLVAPGGWIVAARSSAFDPADPEGMLGGSIARFEAQRRGEDRIAVAGSPVPAALGRGSVALAPGPEPGAPDERRIDEVAALAASAAPLGGAAGFDARVGSGLLDVPRYLAIRGSDSAAFSELDVACTRDHVTPGARDVSMIVRSRDGGSAPLRALLVRGTARESIASGRLAAGYAVLPLGLPLATIGEPLHIELEARGVVHGDCVITVTAIEGEGAAPRIGGAGGCTIGPGPSRSGLALAWLLGLTAVVVVLRGLLPAPASCRATTPSSRGARGRSSRCSERWVSSSRRRPSSRLPRPRLPRPRLPRP